MMRINLLPWRTEKRKKQRRLIGSGIVTIFLFVIAIIVGKTESSEPPQETAVETAQTRHLKIFKALKAENDGLLNTLDTLLEAIPSSLALSHLDKQGDTWNIEGEAVSKELITTLIKKLKHSRLISLKQLAFHIQIKQENNQSSSLFTENLETLKTEFCIQPAELPTLIEIATQPWQVESFQLEEKDDASNLPFSLLLRSQAFSSEEILSQLKRLNAQLPFKNFSFTLSDKQLNLALEGALYEINNLYCKAPTTPPIKQAQQPDLKDALQLVGIIQTQNATWGLIAWKDSSKIEKVKIGQFLKPIEATVVNITDRTLQISTEASTIEFALKE